MDVVNEDGKGHLAASLDHAAEQDGTSASEDTFACPNINTMLTQEVIEFIEEFVSHAADQQLHFSGKHGRFAADYFINVAVLQETIKLRITFAGNGVVERDNTLLEAFHDLQIRAAITKLENIDRKTADVDDVRDTIILEIAEFGDGGCQSLCVTHNLGDSDGPVFAAEFKVNGFSLAKVIAFKAGVLAPIMIGR